MAGQATEDTSARWDSVLKAHRYELQIRNGRLMGPAAAFLDQAVRGTQFVSLGESHNNRDVPLFTSALFRMLSENHGFGYLAIESGSTMVTPLGRAPRVGNADSVRAYARRYPNGLQFTSDQELDMIAEIGRLSRAAGTRVWGVDQEYGGLHMLERLVALAQSPQSRTLAERVTVRAREYDAERHRTGDTRYISRMAKTADFDSLKEVFRAATGSEAAYLIDALQTSHRIYQNNIFARERMSGYESNREREELMKTRFLEFYREAQRAGVNSPRVLLKLGHWHIIRGLNWGRQFTLGDFAANLARANDQKALSIALYLNNDSGNYGVLKQYPDYEPFARAALPNGWTLLDLRPLRPFVQAGRIRLNAEQERIVLGFDLALLISNTAAADFATIGR